MWRYFVLHHEGGVYADLDVEVPPSRPPARTPFPCVPYKGLPPPALLMLHRVALPPFEYNKG